MIQRRDFITLLGGAATWPFAGRAQQPTVPVVGRLNPTSSDTNASQVAAFLEGLKEVGFTEGRNVALEYRWAEGHNDRIPALAADLVRRRVTVIVTGGTLAALAAKAATSTIPIVFQFGTDPVKAGLVASLNRPGGNVTGITNYAGILAAKRLELLHQLTPDATTIGVLVDPTGANAGTNAEKTDLLEAASVLGLKLDFLNASNEQEIDTAFATLVQQRVGALLLPDVAFYNSRREQLVTLARFNAIPTMYTFREFAVAGGLISYASSLKDSNRQAGIYTGRILKGEKPGDLPIQLPTKFELVINLKTAKVLGIAIPPNLLAIADEVIE